MNRLVSRIARPILITAGILSLGLAGWYVSNLAHYNPFLNFQAEQPNPLGYPIHLQNAELSVWTGAKLQTRANIGSLDVRRDLAIVQANHVTNGLFTSGKNTFAYEAAGGTYNMDQGQLVATGNSRIKGTDFNISSPGFDYDEKTQLLSVYQNVTGTLSGGNLTAASLRYSLADRSWSTGAIHWVGIPQGKLAQTTQATADNPDDDQPHRWDITALQSRGLVKDGRQIRTFLQARATDGRLIVEAPTIEQDVKTDVLTCQGPVRYFSAKVDLTCDQAMIYHREDRAVLSGRVVMYFKPKDAEVLNPQDPVPVFQPLTPDQVDKDHPPVPMVMTPTNKKVADDLRSDQTLRKYPATVFADKVVYYYKKGFRKAVITGQPQAQQELTEGTWRRIWGVDAYYNGEAETLRIAGPANAQNVRVKDSIGDDFTTDWLETSTVENSGLYSTGVMSGHYFMDNKDLNDATKQAGSTDSTTGSSSGKSGGNSGGSTGGGATGDSTNKGNGKNPPR